MYADHGGNAKAGEVHKACNAFDAVGSPKPLYVQKTFGEGQGMMNASTDEKEEMAFVFQPSQANCIRDRFFFRVFFSHTF